MRFVRTSVVVSGLIFGLSVGCGDSSSDSEKTTTGDPANEGEGSGGGTITIPVADSGPGPAAECQPNAQGSCACPRGNQGQKICQGGMWSECFCGVDLSDAGLPAPSACPATATCRSTMGFTQGVDAVCIPTPMGDGGAAPGGPGGGMGGFGIPPRCADETECDAAGLPDAKCLSLMLPILGPQQLCVQPCVM